MVEMIWLQRDIALTTLFVKKCNQSIAGAHCTNTHPTSMSIFKKSRPINPEIDKANTNVSLLMVRHLSLKK